MGRSVFSFAYLASSCEPWSKVYPRLNALQSPDSVPFSPDLVIFLRGEDFSISHQILRVYPIPLRSSNPQFQPFCHACFASCRTLISCTGIDQSGRKGIFPSNYVRLSGRTRPVGRSRLTCFVLLTFRSCSFDYRRSSILVFVLDE